MNTAQIEIANATENPHVAIRYDATTRSFGVNMMSGIPINELIGHLRVFSTYLEVGQLERGENGQPAPSTLQGDDPGELPLVVMHYDAARRTFRNEIHGLIPINELIGFVAVLTISLGMGQCLQMQAQAQQQKASGITIHNKVPPISKLLR